MAGVIISVEPNQIAMQNTQKELIADWQDTIDLTAGERGMQKEANLDIFLAVANLLAQHFGQQHEMVIMHPDEIAVLDFLGDGSGKKAICLLVRFPSRFVKGDFTGVVVEQRPEDGVCDGRSDQYPSVLRKWWGHSLENPL